MNKFTLKELREGIEACEDQSNPLDVIAYAQLSLARIEFNKYLEKKRNK